MNTKYRRVCMAHGAIPASTFTNHPPNSPMQVPCRGLGATGNMDIDLDAETQVLDDEGRMKAMPQDVDLLADLGF